MKPREIAEQARLYGILDAGYLDPNLPEHWLRMARALIDGGCDLLEFRAKGLSIDAQAELIDLLQPVFAKAAVPLIINDHLELALRHPGLGLHIGQDDGDPREIRQALGPDRILGLSTHSLPQAESALGLGETLSYFCSGPVFATPTKPEYEAVGLNLIRAVAALPLRTPWFVIGGVKSTNLDTVREAGAQRVCVVSELLQAEQPAELARKIRNQLTRTYPQSIGSA